MAPHGKGRLEGKTSIIGGRKRKLIGKGVRDPDIQASELGKKAGTSTSTAERCKGKNNRREPTKDVDVGVAEGKGKRDEGKGKKKASGKDEIDDIFADVKRLKEEKIVEEAERAAKKKKIKEEHRRRQANPFRGQANEQNQRWAWADEVKPVRYDDDGLPIYTWESLRIGQGGGTDLCPFDCDCCF